MREGGRKAISMIDIEELLKPVSPEEPCGVDLAYDPANCGICGFSCENVSPNMVCVDKTCACEEGFGFCGGACVPFDSTATSNPRSCNARTSASSSWSRGSPPVQTT